MFNINIQLINNQIVSKLIVDSYFFNSSDYEYSFYLYKDEEFTDRQLYSKNIEAVFDLNGKFGNFYIRAYIRDLRDLDVRAYNSKTLYIGK